MPISIDAASKLIRSKRDGLKRELADVAPYTFADHKHLDANTPERAYWHYGYINALEDVLRLLVDAPSQKSSSEGKSS